MKFIEKCETSEKFYSVDYSKQKLEEILEKLKDYSYTTIGHCQLVGDITKWPATDKNIKKRTASFFNTTKKSTSAKLLPETISHYTENNSIYVTYDYLYNKLPDLYAYIDLIVNDTDIFNYTGLFEKAVEEKTGSYNMFYAAAHQDQFVLEGILNYIDSPELTNHNSINEEEYDYKGLNKLYKEMLECFTFNLIATKEYLKEPIPVNGLSFKLRK